MKTALIDAERIESKQDLHRVLAEQLNFPEWYGGNLDAMYDLLSAERDSCLIVIENAPELSKKLGEYFGRFLRVLTDLCIYNPSFGLKIEKYCRNESKEK